MVIIKLFRVAMMNPLGVLTMAQIKIIMLYIKKVKFFVNF